MYVRTRTVLAEEGADSVCVCGGGGGLVGVCKIVGTSWEGVDCVRVCVSYSIFLFAGYCC